MFEIAIKYHPYVDCFVSIVKNKNNMEKFSYDSIYSQKLFHHCAKIDWIQGC